jgi:1,4-alpha-glucan branching enzyme
LLFAGNTEKLIKENQVNEFDVRSALESEHYHLHKFLGVNRDMILDEIYIRLWAPNAKAVSLIADFNDWSISASPMKKVDEAGIWSLTLPPREKAFSYQFAIHQSNGEIKIINDPFARESMVADRYSSYYSDSSFEWQDQDWIKKRESSDIKDQVLVIKSLDLDILKEREFNNFQGLANYVYEQGTEENFTHVELSNFFEAIIDLSYSNKFALNKEALLFTPSSAFGQINDFKCFINFLHQKGIGVVLNLPYFSNELIANHGAFKTLQKPIHENFYLSNIIYWLEEMHIDGFNFGPLEQVLMKENSKNHHFLLKANNLIHKRSRGVFSIAQETSCFNLLTSAHKDSLNFDFKLNIVWLKQIIEILRGKQSNLESFGSNLLSENFLLGLMKNFDTKGLTENDFKILISLSYLLPSKKYFKQSILDEIFAKFKNLRPFYEDISILYEEEKILHKTDLLSERFCVTSIENNIIVFQRWSYDFKELVITAVNFANTAKQSFQIDVPKGGFYKEIFDSSNYSKQSTLSNDDGVYTYSNQKSLSNKSIVIDIPAKTVLCYTWSN